MSDYYYLKSKPNFTSKTEVYTYEYDKVINYAGGSDTYYYVDIIFENDEFARIDFGKSAKDFSNNLRPKELYLFEQIKNEIENIKERREKEKHDELKIKLKEDEEVTKLLNSIHGQNSQMAKDALSVAMASVLSCVLNNLGGSKISYGKLDVPSVKITVPLEYEIEIFNPNLQKEVSQVSQSPVEWEPPIKI